VEDLLDSLQAQRVLTPEETARVRNCLHGRAGTSRAGVPPATP
jgi:hypothetical protein